jgi:hypothetical protein
MIYMQYGKAAWTNSMDKQHGQAAWASSMDIQHGDMDITP